MGFGSMPKGRQWFDKTPRVMVGFTLMEVLVVLALLAVLASVAIPRYQIYIFNTRRADAETALMQLRSAMERFYPVCYTYIGAAEGGDDGSACDQGSTAGATGSPRIFPAQTPSEGAGQVHYKLSIVVSTDTDFWLRAEPVNSQEDDPCGCLYLHSSGLRGSDNTDSTARCWNNTAENAHPSEGVCSG